jgi:Methyltransferase domain
MRSVEYAKRTAAVALRARRSLSVSRRQVFVTTAPSAQTAVNAVPDVWASRLPGSLRDVRAGGAELFDDERIHWAFERLGGIAGAKVLDLGPLEGGYSYMAQQAGAAKVTGIEANGKAFLKCLVTKELLGLDRCSFLCGEVTAYLKAHDEPVDVCIASGILYHMVDPLNLLELISQRATHLVMWTHVYASEALDKPELARRLSAPRSVQYGGEVYQLARHSYGVDYRLGGFWGGTTSFSNWMARDSLLSALTHFGWDNVQLAFDEPHGSNGPALMVVATKGAS